MILSDYLTLSPKRELIFDFDETLFQLLLPWNVYKQRGKDIASEYDYSLAKNWDGSPLELMNEIIKIYGEEAKSKFDKMAAEFEVGELDGYNPNLELINFINNYHEKYSMFIWSSNSMELIEKILTENKLLDKFTSIVSRNKTLLLKPNPDGFSLILKPETKKSDYIMIGDSLTSDGGAARNAGIDFFHIQYFKK